MPSRPLEGTLSDAAPILWQYGALARLKKGEPIDKLLYGGYSTISLGYAGLYECVKYMTGKSHTDSEATPFAMAVMQKMNDKCTKWKAENRHRFQLVRYAARIHYVQVRQVAAAPLWQHPWCYRQGLYHQQLSRSCDQKRSMRSRSSEFESQFQQLSPGGAISYVEVPDMQDNLKAVVRVMQYIYDNIMYAELNTKSDYCQECGFDGEIQIVEDDGKQAAGSAPHCGTAIRRSSTLLVVPAAISALSS